MISRSTIDRVFEAARVEEVVGEFVQLKKAGSNFKGLSPFTDEKSPSFMVSPVKQIWKDFSTGKGGNAISFLMEHEHYTYPEAIKWLANKYNIEIEETEQTNQEKELVNERESMFVVSDFAKDFFHNTMLKTNQGKAIGLSYFKERGFRDETIEKFDLGYCLDEWDHFTNAAIAKGYQLKYLESTGLTIVKDNKQFDRFKGRVIFPIHSMSGRTLGFGGRILTNDKKAAKYLNSPESDIYHKGKVLYGIFQAKKEIAKQDNCFLVEGYTDVISFHQSGIENVVASSGTALTPDQIRLISRLTKNITVLFDGDAAGIRASIRGIDLILEQGMNVKVVQFPNGEDPDSFAKSHSDSELQAFLETAAQDFINFKVSLLLEDTQNDPVKKAGLIRDIVASISKIPDAIQREVYVQECARIMEISERILFSELAQLLSKNNTEESKKYQAEKKTFEVVKRQDIQLKEIDQLEILEREIIKLLLLYGNEEVDFMDEIIHIDENGKEIKTPKKYKNSVSTEIYLQLHDDEIHFTNSVFQEIYNEIIFQLNNFQKLELDQLINHINPTISSTVTSILMDEEKYQLSQWERKNIFVTETKEVLMKAVTDAIYNIRRILIDKLLKEKSIKEKEYSNDEIEEIMNYNSLRIRLSEKLNRVV
ncbi:MAG: DNA primase [Flavobacteriia bacterium]|nr:DNA primase [Flavobacteriia bacterium]OIP48135.1 MAG: DNA primase [Flavobacteriaceae bacterium CG2_30_31_66]PIV97841.1 MAG: DNA primase [Flavobacteriaceae bacterium CG17_big_fil_post_rev_8_21_14_2_50_31_13]PIX11062.1 MAG: DNA primase [Flavobacteriaceae bacterium CG_4_8_14_3_um_filter_31_8]PIY14582.1 MAG: DNA primase [Flavobacteriaceae bacterium CG_4_10_14_3_um_filter_31_253]PIZ10849.1 MAG: DNA primase [Flavobacteriaceae bacterium CG_4_10_14_0_8_um_filter_31_99]PJC08656.1 MAG: DNA primase [